jgi:hypothetical protein
LGGTSGLVIGQTYTFAVAATNDAGVQSTAATSNSVVESAAPLGVTGLTATDDGRGSVVVKWSCDTTCADGSAVTTFTVATSPAVPSSPSTVTDPGASTTSFSATISGLSDSTSYTVSVAASNTWGAGQAVRQVVVSEGQPTATITGYSPNGLSETVSFTVNANGSSVTGCSITGLTGGASSGGSNCNSLSVNVPMYNTGYSATLTITSDFAPSGAAGASISFTSGDKALLADATPDYGTCPASNPPPYCGGNSNMMPTPAFQTGEPVVAQGTTVYASCQTQGASITNGQSSDPNLVSSSTWLRIPASNGYMSDMWFNPPGGAADSGLPAC